ncbi:coenzyme F420-0:L-glutamate ligase/coenzyme F420-1:gamma-L-glutamate ligase [Kineococcus xinjiangensis]|uniref:Coenzyme F420-0:L-glutamate ligase/coenzyme F420-1:gamma-L-glutamate ligase n=1 Tax=Kineococcus xinjiangensis TaxID=512762 RepID=A0A2S6IU70_9ACTN|nr:coenzyme F420-0:L-glutamate ligase/coenzyme F420-1:gamma-L-glutamate ligase [Kineococcus xinjiangensis]
MPAVPVLEVRALTGMGEVRAGDDLAALLVAALPCPPADGDVLAVSSKVWSKAEGLTRPAAERDAAVAEQSRRTVAARRTTRGLAAIVESAAGPVMAAAGVDASNTPAGTVLLLPADPDEAARRLRARLRELTGVRLAVVLTDTAGRPWRVGQTDFALGCAGLRVGDDLRGGVDAEGRPLEVTVRALADEVAAAADLVKGKVLRVPAALVRGLAAEVGEEDGPGAASLLRAPGEDWFRLGHVEAVRAALGAAHLAPPPVAPGPVGERVRRAVAVALAAGGGGCTALPHGREVRLAGGDGVALGMLVQRLLAALWAEDLRGVLRRDGDVVVVSAETARQR